MADIVNLRRQRKRVERAGREAEAAERRIRFGRSKPEREAAAGEAERQARLLDGHARERRLPATLTDDEA